MTPLRNDYFIVSVPEGLKNPMFCTEKSIHRIMDGAEGDDELIIRESVYHSSLPKKTTIDLPPGSYTIVSMADKITEEQAEQIVERKVIPGDTTEKTNFRVGYKDYGGNTWRLYRKATKSFRSLLSSLSLTPETSLIIKLNKEV